MTTEEKINSLLNVHSLPVRKGGGVNLKFKAHYFTHLQFLVFSLTEKEGRKVITQFDIYSTL